MHSMQPPSQAIILDGVGLCRFSNNVCSARYEAGYLCRFSLVFSRRQFYQYEASMSSGLRDSTAVRSLPRALACIVVLAAMYK